jgi:valyl-tRNA synthetase
MPFITEEIWQQLGGAGESLLVAEWPRAEAAWRDESAEQAMEALMQVVAAARKLRAEQNLPPAQRVTVAVHTAARQTHEVLRANEEAVLLLARGEGLTLATGTPEQAVAEVIHCFGEPAVVSIAAEVSQEELRNQQARLEKELKRLQEEEGRLAAKLANEEFTSRAPQPVVAKVQAQHSEAKERREAVERQLVKVGRSLA